MRLAIAGLILILTLTHAFAQGVPSALKRNANPQNEPTGSQSVVERIGDKVEDRIFAALAEPFKKLADFVGQDLEAAATLAVAIPTLQDTNGQACWIAMKDFGEVVQAHPVPLTFRAATDLQALRLLTMTANKLCANPACTIIFSDLANTAQTASPIPLPIPSLSQLCSKVAQLSPMLPKEALGVTLPAAPTVIPVTPAK